MLRKSTVEDQHFIQCAGRKRARIGTDVPGHGNQDLAQEFGISRDDRPAAERGPGTSAGQMDWTAEEELDDPVFKQMCWDDGADFELASRLRLISDVSSAEETRNCKTSHGHEPELEAHVEQNILSAGPNVSETLGPFFHDIFDAEANISELFDNISFFP
eukprot:TRINITY_DN30800_c0_g1_i1.p1 TRINITY_DN30800_c0_g1~~TRINITY_DN30800_c0_g1_i1.p1  ORF type:complete len:160 (+),score=18.06 TRINITY_DN30800_c0_g1_i1:210-689(+)